VKSALRDFLFFQVRVTITINTPPKTSIMTAPPDAMAIECRSSSFFAGEEIVGSVGIVDGEVGLVEIADEEATEGVVVVEGVNGLTEGEGVGHSSTCTASQSSEVRAPCCCCRTTSLSSSSKVKKILGITDLIVKVSFEHVFV
jgi:hypothetical protein